MIARRTLVALAAGLATLAAAAATAWIVEEEQQVVRRFVPATVPFDPAHVRALRVPDGYAVTLFASGLGTPRMMETAPDGTVLVTRPDAGDVVALRDRDGDGRADEARIAARGLPGVHGIDIDAGALFLASSTTLWTAPLAAGAQALAPRAIVTGLPDGGQHANRMVRVGPDGRLFVSVGSSCNDCAEDNQLERATVIRYERDGSGREILANGLRNTIGYDWQPGSATLWGMDHGSDFHGDRTPPEELNRIVAGGNHGWPICYGRRVVDPMTNARPEDLALAPGQSEPSGLAVTREAWCARTEPAWLTLPAHSAPMAMRFVRGDGFGPGVRGDAFVALHGSWNRGEPVGYKVVRLRFAQSGVPVGVEDFLTGFLLPDGRAVIGRPVGLAFAADGALLVSDDSSGAIYRISRAR